MDFAIEDSTKIVNCFHRGGNAVLTKYITPASDIQITVVVPGEIDGYSVIGLEGTFKENQRIEKAIIPEGVHSNTVRISDI